MLNLDAADIAAHRKSLLSAIRFATTHTLYEHRVNIRTLLQIPHLNAMKDILLHILYGEIDSGYRISYTFTICRECRVKEYQYC